MMVLNTQMKYLFSYKMFIRYLYLYISVYTRKAEKAAPSQGSSRSFAGGSPPWVKAMGFEANKHLTSRLLTRPPPCLWERARKRRARNPEAGLPPRLPVFLASSCANSHREQLLPPPTAATACQPGTRMTLKEKLQISHHPQMLSEAGGFKVQLSRGRFVIIAVFNLEHIKSVELLFYPCQLTHPWVKPGLGSCRAVLLLLVLCPPRAFHLLPSSAGLGRGGTGLAAISANCMGTCMPSMHEGDLHQADNIHRVFLSFIFIFYFIKKYAS